eukprot:TRINITY_DN11914_c0_g1_i1.p1 TRINITY_DN11914_c0_g1~~TRINITY_DN11914_c0_g1_i1.p1  ORF type:complete len:359 (+),score=11.89 TRINITY_DN11914_c0_g1_i1:120-1079(+)
MIVVQLPFARNKRLGFGVVLLIVLCFTLLLSLTAHFKAVQNQISIEFQGFVLACIVTLWEAFGLLSVTLVWRRFYSAEVEFEAYFALVAITVQSAEALRLVSLLGAVVQDGQIVEDWYSLSRRVLAYSSFSVLFELGSRSLCFIALFGSIFGYRVSVSPELDVILRCKFVFSYTPFLVLVFTLPINALAGKEWLLTWTVPLAIVLAIIPELLTDFLLVLLYTCKRRGSFFRQLKLLQKPGTHSVFLPSALDFSALYGDCFERQNVASGDPVRAPGTQAVETKWICVVAAWNFVVVSSSIFGVMGQCNYNHSDAFCKLAN